MAKVQVQLKNVTKRFVTKTSILKFTKVNVFRFSALQVAAKQQPCV